MDAKAKLISKLNDGSGQGSDKNDKHGMELRPNDGAELIFFLAGDVVASTNGRCDT